MLKDTTSRGTRQMTTGQMGEVIDTLFHDSGQAVLKKVTITTNGNYTN
jgi:hypothetical protein